MTTSSTVHGHPGINLLFDSPGDGRDLTIMPGRSAFIGDSKDNGIYRTWHDYKIDDGFDLEAFGNQAMTPEMEKELLDIADGINALVEKARKILEQPGPPIQVTERLRGYLSEDEIRAPLA